MKNFKILMLSFLIVASAFTSCSKDESSNPTSHKVIFKAMSSADASIGVVVHTNASGDQTTNSSVNSKTFTSAELTIPSSVQVIGFAANGSGANANSTLKVQIYVDGNLVKENVSTGTVLSASTTYTF